MDVLQFCTSSSRQSGADEAVIESLRVGTKEVSILFRITQSDDIVESLQARDGSKCAQGLDDLEFVEVSSCDDGSISVLVEDAADEAARNLCLSVTLVNSIVDWWARVSVKGGAATCKIRSVWCRKDELQRCVPLAVQCPLIVKRVPRRLPVTVSQ